MAKFVVSIDMDNEAFDEFPEHELARLLQEAANKIGGRDTTYRGGPIVLQDRNGNTVGFAKVEK